MELFDKKIYSKINFLGISIYALFLPIMQNPYKPFFNINFIANKIQFVDIIFLLISPFLLIQIFSERKIIFEKFKFQIISIIIYVFSIFISIKNFGSTEAIYQLFAALYLSMIFLSVLVVINSKEKLIFVGKSIIAGYLINILLSIIALLIFYFFNQSWTYIIHENKVFPYLGEVVRLTGTLKPTAKLLSSYLTLIIPSLIALSISSKGYQRYFFLIITIFSLIIFPFTLSRGIVGLFFSIAFLFSFFQKRFLIDKITFRLTSFLFIIFFIVTSTLSTIHLKDISSSYSYDGYLNHPNTVYYFYHPKKGMEKISLDIKFARDHYYWLKKASVIMLKENPNGIGVGNFSRSLKLLEKDKLIPEGLSAHPTPQSEIFFAAAERGFFGAISLIILFISWLYPLYKNKKDLLVYAGLGSLIALCFIDSLYLEITKFRFLWFLVGFILIYSKDFSKGCKNEISTKG